MTDVESAIPVFYQNLDAGFFKVRYDRCTQKEKMFIFAMVKCGDLPCTIANVASIIYANQSYIGIHAVQDGSVTLELPEARNLREVFSDETYTADNKLTLELCLGDTRLFEYID